MSRVVVLLFALLAAPLAAAHDDPELRVVADRSGYAPGTGGRLSVELCQPEGAQALAPSEEAPVLRLSWSSVPVGITVSELSWPEISRQPGKPESLRGCLRALADFRVDEGVPPGRWRLEGVLSHDLRYRVSRPGRLVRHEFGIELTVLPVGEQGEPVNLAAFRSDGRHALPWDTTRIDPCEGPDLRVRTSSDRERYRPGDLARLSVETCVPLGRPYRIGPLQWSELSPALRIESVSWLAEPPLTEEEAEDREWGDEIEDLPTDALRGPRALRIDVRIAADADPGVLPVAGRFMPHYWEIARRGGGARHWVGTGINELSWDVVVAEERSEPRRPELFGDQRVESPEELPKAVHDPGSACPAARAALPRGNPQAAPPAFLAWTEDEPPRPGGDDRPMLLLVDADICRPHHVDDWLVDQASLQPWLQEFLLVRRDTSRQTEWDHAIMRELDLFSWPSLAVLTREGRRLPLQAPALPAEGRRGEGDADRVAEFLSCALGMIDG